MRYNLKGVANSLLLSQVKIKHCVTYNSAASKASFVVHKNDGSERRFEQAKNGLFYLGTEQSSGTVLVNTVDKNKSRYTNREYQSALLAPRKIQNTVGRSSTRNFTNIVRQNLLKNCPVTTEEGIMVAEDIFGPNLGSLKGKKARCSGEHIAMDQQGECPER